MWEHFAHGADIGIRAFDPAAGGVISASGVGFDISYGASCLVTEVRADDLAGVAGRLADALFAAIPARGRLDRPMTPWC